MTRRKKLILAAGIGLAAVAGGAGLAMAQPDASAALRATGKVGEQADGYLGVVGSADAALRARVDAVNIKRRAYYTDLAAKRGAKIEEVAAATACEIFASRVQPGQYFKLSGGAWQKRDAAPVPRPAYCG
ncbi:MAG TPA: YdbL family protein [Allosphingosinicella sp.]|nr:YdbL family protein [Allosphingosinicella sp.]